LFTFGILKQEIETEKVIGIEMEGEGKKCRVEGRTFLTSS
jgi:hypothetical protein